MSRTNSEDREFLIQEKISIDGKSPLDNIRPPTPKKEDANRNMKYYALLALVIQNASLVLCMRYAKTRAGAQFTNSTAVVMAELTKLITCMIVVYFEVDQNIRAWRDHLRSFLVNNFVETLKVAVPAFMYVIQNNLLYLAVENLPAATYQVSYQIKILTTAIFSITMLGKEIHSRQWLALFLLFLGVAVVQLNNGKSTERAAQTEQNQFLGFGAVILACCSSGFAGVYFEKILKGSNVSLWTRNIQLGLFGCILGLMTALFKDGDAIFTNGWFYGYDFYTYLIIGNAACGGLLVAVVIKYADNILKGFACSISIIVSAFLAVFLFDFQITGMFVVGTSFVIAAVYLYSLPPKQRETNL